MPFCGLSASLYHQNHPAAVGGILYSGGLAIIFAGLEFGGLLYLQLLQPKGQATPHANLAAYVPGRRGIRPASGCIHLKNMPLFPPPQLSCR
jgi:hypothetical protein